MFNSHGDTGKRLEAKDKNATSGYDVSGRTFHRSCIFPDQRLENDLHNFPICAIRRLFAVFDLLPSGDPSVPHQTTLRRHYLELNEIYSQTE
jgi:hypothetical protein